MRLCGQITPIQLRLGNKSPSLRILSPSRGKKQRPSFPLTEEGYENLVAKRLSWSWIGVSSRLSTSPMKKYPPPISIVRARALRRNASDAEMRMKWLLKEQFPEARFRFQVPIRHYIVDFASHRLKIVIEIDGGQHADDADAARTAEIEAEGYSVIRFWNNEVLQNGEGCLVVLAQFLAARSPQSSYD